MGKRKSEARSNHRVKKKFRKLLELISSRLSQNKENRLPELYQKVIVQKIVDYDDSPSSVFITSERDLPKLVSKTLTPCYTNVPEEKFCKVKDLGQNHSDEFNGSDTDRGSTSYDIPSYGVENTHTEILEENSFSPLREIQNQDKGLLSDEDPFETDDDSVADIDYSPSEESSETTSDENLIGIDQKDSESDDLNTHSSGETDTWGPIVPRDQDFVFKTTQQTNYGKAAIKDPIDAYKLFVTDDILDHIVEETNRYAAACLTASSSTRQPKHSTASKDTNVDELQTFLAIIITMGLVPMPKASCYWSKDYMYNNKFVSGIYA
nr:unnamed protein product [Callosobruchus chinensis]